MKKLNFRSDFAEYVDEDFTTFTFNAISVRGERHQKDNEHNQDYFKCSVKSDLKYAIVADGLGSAKHSHIGSEKAVEILEEMIKASFHPLAPVSEIDIYEFNSKLLEKWKGCFLNETREYDTTLLYVIIFSHGVLTGSIGDGLILWSMKNEVVHIKEEKNSFSNQTYSLASNQALDYFKFDYTPVNFEDELPIVFILTTDGVSDDLKPDVLKQLPAYLNKELEDKGVKGMQKVLGDWIINWETENHSDDRTFCLLTIGKAGEKA
ncbi:serine/threonine protein phosphatase PrpC [Evansella vedderi]|uniref:Serine/threonine protein phosphatase PrpC n=1 Tax=Evansella vedderi TaxID=38282 RepID=A0ABU0A4A4_9BACI|nr:PP2C family serine/threonine-protein phosphatase [Evansella vedderi]MDQ0257847.1 serine/threonine protein phosphatase PrpC [Evansella vedderi]